jgi:O-antigen/teichoic acid export membrane protein
MRTSLVFSIADQAMLSAFNFGLAILLIRMWAPEVFGIYAVVLALTFMAMSGLSAIVGSQLAVLRPAARRDGYEDELLAALWLAGVLMIAAVVVLSGLGLGLIWSELGPTLAAGAACFVGGTLLREYVRIYHFSALRVAPVFFADALYVGMGVLCVAGLYAKNGSLDVASLVWLLGAASALAALPTLLLHAAQFRLRWNRDVRSRFAGIWRMHSRWALLGAFTTEIHYRFHVFILAGVFGTAAAGTVQAGALIFRPMDLMMMAWARIAQPTFARAFAEGRMSAAGRLAHLSALGITAAAALFLAVVWAAWPVLEAHVFRDAYADMATVVALWAAAMLVRLVCDVYSIEMQGLAKFRELTLASIAGASVALITLAGVVAVGNYQWTILAVVLGHVADLAVVLWIRRRALRGEAAIFASEPAGAPAGAGVTPIGGR